LYYDYNLANFNSNQYLYNKAQKILVGYYNASNSTFTPNIPNRTVNFTTQATIPSNQLIMQGNSLFSPVFVIPTSNLAITAQSASAGNTLTLTNIAQSGSSASITVNTTSVQAVSVTGTPTIAQQTVIPVTASLNGIPNYILFYPESYQIVFTNGANVSFIDPYNIKLVVSGTPLQWFLVIYPDYLNYGITGSGTINLFATTFF
ncbi:MAG: hypothetical protein ACP5LM_04120, partial [Thermoplasmata archaeon]